MNPTQTTFIVQNTNSPKSSTCPAFPSMHQVISSADYQRAVAAADASLHNCRSIQAQALDYLAECMDCV